MDQRQGQTLNSVEKCESTTTLVNYDYLIVLAGQLFQMKHVLRKRLGETQRAGESGVIRQAAMLPVARFVTYSVAVLVSTADGFPKSPTRVEIAAEFPLLLGRFLSQLDHQVIYMLQIG